MQVDRIKERKKVINSVFYPMIFVVLLWVIEIIQISLGERLGNFGLYPRSFDGLLGILTTPLLHSGISHLFNNSIPLLVMGTALFYFYGKVGYRVVLWIVLLGGIWTWISARPSYHIGASGLVYGLFGFLLLSGFIRKHKGLISISFLMAFVYGSLVWGILPIDQQISWEGHLWGLLAGLSLAWYYRKEGPQREIPKWEEDDEDDDDDEDDNAYWKVSGNDEVVFRYVIKKDRNTMN